MSNLKTFYEAIGYQPYQELRVFGSDNKIMSFFPTNFEETAVLLTKLKEYNCYVGVNPRKEKGKKSVDVAHRRMMVFDLEAIGKKPQLSNKKYMKQLEEGVSILRKEVSRITNAKVTFIVASGRGIHLYYRIKPLDVKYQEEYITLYNYIIRKANKAMKHLLIKADPPVKDLPRIFGAPGTKNIKYEEESAMREIKYYADTETDLQKVIDVVKVNMNKRVSKIKKRKISLEAMRKRPEYLIFKHKPTKKTGINNRLRWPLKLLMREAGFTYEETEIIAHEIYEMGYDKKPMFLGNNYPDAKYSERILQNYCLEFYEWCVDNNFPFPYPKKFILNENYLVFESKEKVDFTLKHLHTFNEVKDYIIAFNQHFVDETLTRKTFYTKSLYEHLRLNCNSKLFTFIQPIFHNIKFRMKSYDEKDEVLDYLEGIEE